MIEVPEQMGWWRGHSGGAEWLARLPELAQELAELWRLRLGAPFPGSNVSLVLPVEREDGLLAVLKINFPDRESEAEADALAHWVGDGAVLLLDHDEERRALLVERCVPGTQLWQLPDEDETTRIAADVLLRLWRPPPSFHRFLSLTSEAANWAAALSNAWEALARPFERPLLDEALDAIRELASGGGDVVVLHQDFHGGNVLRAQRQPWLAIDPKPLVGERAFDAASLLRDRRPLVRRDAADVVRRRLDVLADALGVDRERMRRWGVVHALAWGVSGPPINKVEDDMLECARLLVLAA